MPAHHLHRAIAPAALLLGLALAVPSPSSAQLPTPASEVDLHALLLARGFTDIEAVDFDDGLWSATATAPDGGRAALHVHPASSAIFLDDATPGLDAGQVEDRLAALGYQDIHNPRFEDGVWKVEVESPTGQELRVFVDPAQGGVLGEYSD